LTILLVLFSSIKWEDKTSIREGSLTLTAPPPKDISLFSSRAVTVQFVLVTNVVVQYQAYMHYLLWRQSLVSAESGVRNNPVDIFAIIATTHRHVSIIIFKFQRHVEPFKKIREHRVQSHSFCLHTLIHTTDTLY